MGPMVCFLVQVGKMYQPVMGRGGGRARHLRQPHWLRQARGTDPWLSIHPLPAPGPHWVRLLVSRQIPDRPLGGALRAVGLGIGWLSINAGWAVAQDGDTIGLPCVQGWWLSCLGYIACMPFMLNDLGRFSLIWLLRLVILGWLVMSGWAIIEIGLGGIIPTARLA